MAVHDKHEQLEEASVQGGQQVLGNPSTHVTSAGTSIQGGQTDAHVSSGSASIDVPSKTTQHAPLQEHIGETASNQGRLSRTEAPQQHVSDTIDANSSTMPQSQVANMHEPDTTPAVHPHYAEYHADIACGTGSHARSKLRHPHAHVIGIDVKPEADVRVHFTDDEWQRFTYIQMDATELTEWKLKRIVKQTWQIKVNRLKSPFPGDQSVRSAASAPRDET